MCWQYKMTFAVWHGASCCWKLKMINCTVVREPLSFTAWLTGIKGLGVCQGNIPHIITLSLPQIHAFDAKFWLTPPSVSLGNLNCCEPVSTVASDSCSWLTWVEPDVIVCCCRPSASRICGYVVCYMRCFLSCNSCREQLSAWLP